MGTPILVLFGIPLAYGDGGERDLRRLRPARGSGEMAAGIAFVALILALAFAAVEVVLYVARRSDRS